MKIGPEDVRRTLERDAASRGASAEAAESGAARRPLSEDEDKVLQGISASYFKLRRGLAALAFAFPVLLWIGAGWDELQTSISAYYHFAPGTGDEVYGAGKVRDPFVGILCAIGAFLYFYKGYSKKENIALNLAGAAAVAIAFFPMDWPRETDVVRSTTAWIHTIAAVSYFLLIAYVCIRRSKDTLEIIADARVRERFRRTYWVLGALMIAAPAAVVALHYAMRQPQDSYWVLGIEVAGTWVFAAFWLVKSRELRAIERQVGEPE